jgi:hypothetical protein
MNGCAAINTEGFISEYEAKPAVWNLLKRVVKCLARRKSRISFTFLKESA